ncbi:choline dehydrogenase-like flavoprotein, partial [Variovorax sp. SG517]|uniref:GMC oxidoreductase n=1 Tax=Variovorax sp. SG517 TaxID=2587117 RepID=UPI00180DA31F
QKLIHTVSRLVRKEGGSIFDGNRGSGLHGNQHADPTERPRIVYHSLSEPKDIETLREGVMRAQAMIESTELSAFRGKPIMPDRPLRNNAEVDAYIRSHAFQQYHPACTCKMGKDETDSVLNPDLSVRGIDGLSVADASVMPNLVSANPNIPVMMLAAKAAAMWLGRE